MNEKLDLIMEPPIFVNELIVQAETEMMFGDTKEIRNWAKERKERYSIEKQASLTRSLLKEYNKK